MSIITMKRLMAGTFAMVIANRLMGENYSSQVQLPNNKPNYAQMQPYQQPAKLEIPRDHKTLDSKVE